MSGINAFLQQNKLQKSRNGICMVAAAYILSFLLLIIGSDTFYGIITKAEKADPGEASDADTGEAYEAFLINVGEAYDMIAGEASDFGQNIIQAEAMQEEIQEEVMREEGSAIAAAGGSTETAALSGAEDTYWFLGYAMNEAEYDSYIRLLGMNASRNKNTREKENSDKENKKDKKEVIESFSETSGKGKAKYNLSQEEIRMLERIVEAEATGEDIIGRILVANVVFNRMADEEFPDTVEEVIFHKVGDEYQFSPLSDKRYWKVEITDMTREAVQRAINGEDYSKGAIYFMSRKRTRKSSAKWFDESLQWLFKHGAHEFFKDKE